MSLALLTTIITLLSAQAEPEGRRARALESLQNHFSTDDYPEEALGRRAEGVVHFSVEIDERGVPARCIIDYSSGDEALDRATCDIMMSRARFDPARDARGRAIPDRISTRVGWFLPDPLQGLPFVTFQQSTSASITDGRISCRWTADDQDPVARQDRQCEDIIGLEGVAFLRGLGADAEFTHVLRVHRDGTPPPSGAAPAGELLAEVTAQLSVAPDGRLAKCRVTRRFVHDSYPTLYQNPDICRNPMLAEPHSFWPDEEATEPRLGTITSRFYLRGGVRERR